MNFGNSIKEIRKKIGLNQKELATACGISQSYLSELESNRKKPNLETMELIATNLGVPLPIILINSIEQDEISEDKKVLFHPLKSILTEILNQVYVDGN